MANWAKQYIIGKPRIPIDTSKDAKHLEDELRQVKNALHQNKAYYSYSGYETTNEKNAKEIIKGIFASTNNVWNVKNYLINKAYPISNIIYILRNNNS